MTDLTKIEKPYVFCTKEEQEGLDALIGVDGALLRLEIISGNWRSRCAANDLIKGNTYRQNPDWNPPKLDVPDWFWDNTDCASVAMDKNGSIFGYVSGVKLMQTRWCSDNGGLCYRFDKLLTHNFNPHNIPWDQSLTVRPGFEE